MKRNCRRTSTNLNDASALRTGIAAALFACIAMAAPIASADTYPSQPIKLVLGYAPGGSVDTIARAIAPDLSAELGETIVMDYKPGASGQIGAQFVAGARPDGYTLHLIESATLVVLPGLRDVGYSATDSFTPVGTVAEGGMLLAAHPSVKARTIPELKNLLSTSNEQLHYATSGVGSVGHVGMELFLMEQGVKAEHVPYKGGGPALLDVLSGQVPLIVSSLAPATPQVKAQGIRPLAITSLNRSSALPDVPTVAEQGLPEFEATAWYALVGPAGMDETVVNRLGSALEKVMMKPNVQKMINDQGMSPLQENAAGLSQRVERDFTKWTGVITAAGITLE